MSLNVLLDTVGPKENLVCLENVLLKSWLERRKTGSIERSLSPIHLDFTIMLSAAKCNGG
jgi:hypothetical protein